MITFKSFNFLTTLILILTFGCGQHSKQTNRARIIQRPAQTTGAPTQVEIQAQNLGINANWEETVVLKDDGYQLELEHMISVNGNMQSIKGTVTLGVGSCDKMDQITYDVFMGEMVSPNTYTAMAVATCWVGHNLHLGLSLMAWNTLGLTQQFVLLNLAQNSIKSIQKDLSQTFHSGYLPDWIARQF